MDSIIKWDILSKVKFLGKVKEKVLQTFLHLSRRFKALTSVKLALEILEQWFYSVLRSCTLSYELGNGEIWVCGIGSAGHLGTGDTSYAVQPLQIAVALNATLIGRPSRISNGGEASMIADGKS